MTFDYVNYYLVTQYKCAKPSSLNYIINKEKKETLDYV